MIYVSSTCSNKTNIRDAILDLVENGFKFIELSGGTKFYPNYLEDLGELRDKYNLMYRLHNYFPPPEKSFVLNLASNNELVLEQSREMIKYAIDISAQFESREYGIHAGFRISPKVEELGKKILGRTILPYADSLKKFIEEFAKLAKYAESRNVNLLLENNVFSAANRQSFEGENPFFLTNSAEYFEMRNKVSFALLLDIAHLKVSCQSQSLDFTQELHTLIAESNYIHISENDGLSDSNNEFSIRSSFVQILKESSLKNKSFTIEVYDGLESVRRCHSLLETLL